MYDTAKDDDGGTQLWDPDLADPPARETEDMNTEDLDEY